MFLFWGIEEDGLWLRVLWVGVVWVFGLGVTMGGDDKVLKVCCGG